MFFAFWGYRVYRSSPKQKGKDGELQVSKILSNLPIDEYTTMNDVVLNTTHGTTQIDHIVISKYGIFVIETKNYRGEIHGNDNKQQWKQVIKTEVTYRSNPWKTYTYITKNEFYNPVRQSLGHVSQVKKLLPDTPKEVIVPMVVFSDKASLVGVDSDIHVIHSFRSIERILSHTTPYLTDQEVEKAIRVLSEENVRDIVNDNVHTQNVRKAREYNNNKIYTEGICPRCGKPLVYKHGRYGDFYGCSGYPECKFTT